MAASVKDFWTVAGENDELLEKLDGATPEQIVEIAKNAGYEFTVSELTEFQASLN